MAISAKIGREPGLFEIHIIGRFDFSSHSDFRKAYEQLQETPEKVEINMKQATFIDSSALGMLLILRDHIGGDDAQIEITHCSAEVRQILEVANFNNLFSIS